MRTFQDNAGRTWTVAINVGAIKRVKGLLEVNLLEIVEGTLIERFVSDPVLLCDVIYAVCKPEADEKDISDEDFGRAMAGDAIEHATKALLEELVGFLPNPRDRANLGKVLAKAQTAQERQRDLVEQQIEGGLIDRVIDAELAKIASRLANAPDSSGSAPESSASIPAPSPSAS